MTTCGSACRLRARAALRGRDEDRRPGPRTSPGRNGTRPAAAGAGRPRAACAGGSRGAQTARRRAGREGHRRGGTLLASDPTGLGWLGWFGSPLAFAFLLGMAGVFGIFLFNQTISLLNALAAQPRMGTVRRLRRADPLRHLRAVRLPPLRVLYFRAAARTGSCGFEGSRNCRGGRGCGGWRRRSRPRPASRSRTT